MYNMLLQILFHFNRMHRTHLKLHLSQQEQDIFRLLNTYRQELHLTTVLRVAGGWVRDKIIGRESHDIDITLDNMKGEEFVLLMQKHSQDKKEQITGFGVTKLNPTMSKHLETATAKILGHSIDFVNLRSETYTEGSRIPNIEDGTPELDALRRDFTVNSLFYNLQTEEVEDYTHRGIADLENKLLRTPLEPYVTFKDDPLRVLRCFRFKAKFGFNIDPQIYQAIEKDEGNTIHQALRNKVSKERRGIELAGILKTDQPLSALAEILKYGFWGLIFEIPAESSAKNTDQFPSMSFGCLRAGMASMQEHRFLTQELFTSDGYSEDQLLISVRLSMLMLPYRSFIVQLNKTVSLLIEHIVKNELKYAAKVSKFVLRVSELVEDMLPILSSPPEDTQLLKVKTVRWLLAAEDKWEIALHAVQAYVLVSKVELKISPLFLRKLILEERLEDSAQLKCFVDGTFLLKRGKKGPIIKIILQNVRVFRALNRTYTKETFEEYYDAHEELFEDAKNFR